MVGYTRPQSNWKKINREGGTESNINVLICYDRCGRRTEKVIVELVIINNGISTLNCVLS